MKAYSLDDDELTSILNDCKENFLTMLINENIISMDQAVRAGEICFVSSKTSMFGKMFSHRKENICLVKMLPTGK